MTGLKVNHMPVNMNIRWIDKDIDYIILRLAGFTIDCNIYNVSYEH